MSSSALVFHIRARKGWQSISVRELWVYRELLGFFVWRDVKIRYRQTFLGGLWAILQPLLAMILFGALFGRVAGIGENGCPYPLFVFAGLVPWTFFANAIGLASNSLVGNEQMIRKIYFPRVLIPLGTIAAFGLDMLITLVLMAVLMLHYHFLPSRSIIFLPLFIIGIFLNTSGFGLMLAAINVRYRDVKYVVPFLTQMALFITPVIFPLSYLPPKLRGIVSLNPLTGLVEGFRYAILGGSASWILLSASLIAACTIFALGLAVFLSMQRIFADVI